MSPPSLPPVSWRRLQPAQPAGSPRRRRWRWCCPGESPPRPRLPLRALGSPQGADWRGLPRFSPRCRQSTPPAAFCSGEPSQLVPAGESRAQSGGDPSTCGAAPATGGGGASTPRASAAPRSGPFSSCPQARSPAQAAVPRLSPLSEPLQEGAGAGIGSPSSLPAPRPEPSRPHPCWLLEERGQQGLPTLCRCTLSLSALRYGLRLGTCSGLFPDTVLPTWI